MVQLPARRVYSQALPHPPLSCLVVLAMAVAMPNAALSLAISPPLPFDSAAADAVPDEATTIAAIVAAASSTDTFLRNAPLLTTNRCYSHGPPHPPSPPLCSIAVAIPNEALGLAFSAPCPFLPGAGI